MLLEATVGCRVVEQSVPFNQTKIGGFGDRPEKMPAQAQGIKAQWHSSAQSRSINVHAAVEKDSALQPTSTPIGFGPHWGDPTGSTFRTA